MERFLTIPELTRFPEVDHLFGTRWVPSPEAIARYLGVSGERVVTVHQVHGDAVQMVESSRSSRLRSEANESSPPKGYDAMITDQPELLLAIATADCVPILMVDEVRRVIAAVHAGWRGSLLGLSAKVVETLKDRFGSRPRNLWVGLGPSAGGCCYEVDRVVLDPLKEKFPDWRSVVQESPNGKALLDLRRLNGLQLASAGVPPGQIHAMDACTICQEDRFYSYRREGRRAGTMFSGIVLRAP